jgi:DNA polymerase-3 subunit epsilon
VREAALADDVLTAAKLCQPRAAAKGLGVPEYFDDLSPVEALEA